MTCIFSSRFSYETGVRHKTSSRAVRWKKKIKKKSNITCLTIACTYSFLFGNKQLCRGREIHCRDFGALWPQTVCAWSLRMARHLFSVSVSSTSGRSSLLSFHYLRDNHIKQSAKWKKKKKQNKIMLYW
jgi:hypothetical protein